MTQPRFASVLVIGAGQAGLSAGYHLQRTGYRHATGQYDVGAETFAVFDVNPAPGGAWQHRWESLTMATVNGIFDLPGMTKPDQDPQTPARTAVPQYFAQFEATMQLPILRPVQVTEVRPADEDPDGDLLVTTDDGQWRTRAIINATGTWNNPLLPDYPGSQTFTGAQMHTRDYVTHRDFTGQRVAVVGGGISALQHLEEISRVATTLWYTRREPVFGKFGSSGEIDGRRVIEEVTAAAEAGKPTSSVVSYTGLIWNREAQAAYERGTLNRRPMFTGIEPYGVREADGSFTSVDTILWATGFRPALKHLDPLGLQNAEGGIQVSGTEVVADPRVHLIGFGPSQSTVGANRAGRDAVRRLSRALSPVG